MQQQMALQQSMQTPQPAAPIGGPSGTPVPTAQGMPAVGGFQ